MHESLRAHHRQEIKPKELLLVPLDGNYHNNKPDRYHAETAIRKNGFSTSRMSHPDWMQAITRHKFVLAPFGHGLDTHRLTEILLMGGVPVIRQSTISSCYDDTDNVIGDGLSRVSFKLAFAFSFTHVIIYVYNHDYRALYL